MSSRYNYWLWNMNPIKITSFSSVKWFVLLGVWFKTCQNVYILLCHKDRMAGCVIWNLSKYHTKDIKEWPPPLKLLHFRQPRSYLSVSFGISRPLPVSLGFSRGISRSRERNREKPREKPRETVRDRYLEGGKLLSGMSLMNPTFGRTKQMVWRWANF